VHERSGVLPEHRDVRNLLDGHHRGREVGGEAMRVDERTGLGEDIDHRHGGPLSKYYDGHHNETMLIVIIEPEDRCRATYGTG
jgi:hypothetical protein